MVKRVVKERLGTMSRNKRKASIEAVIANAEEAFQREPKRDAVIYSYRDEVVKARILMIVRFVSS